MDAHQERLLRIDGAAHQRQVEPVLDRVAVGMDLEGPEVGQGPEDRAGRQGGLLRQRGPGHQGRD